MCIYVYDHALIILSSLGWLWLVGSLKLWVSCAEYSLFYMALLQKWHVISRSLRIVATQYFFFGAQIAARANIFMYIYIYIYIYTYIYMYTYFPFFDGYTLSRVQSSSFLTKPIRNSFLIQPRDSCQKK